MRVARSRPRSAPLDLLRSRIFQIRLFSTGLDSFLLIMTGAGPLLRGASGQHTESYWFYKGFRKFPDRDRSCGLCLSVLQFPFQLSVRSFQFPVSEFHLPGSQFQFRFKLDLSTSVARERVPDPGASTASDKAREPQQGKVNWMRTG